MSEAERVLRRYYREVWERGRLDVLDELLADGYVDHDPPPGFGSDRTSARRLVEAFTAGLREPRLFVLALVAGPDTAAAHWRLDWLQAGPFLGDPAADGRRLSMRGSDLIRVSDGRITDIHHVENVLATLRTARLVVARE
jgi:ketosteroid isomerase-like protein